jgi:hypothetical protein
MTAAVHAGANGDVQRVGYVAAMIAFIATVSYDVAQLLQMVGVLRPPLDGILIFATSLVIAVPAMIAFVALHFDTPAERRVWSLSALLLMVVYVTYVTLNYVVQLAVVIPRLTTPASLAVLDQTPHSLFWTLDALGYLFLGAATAFAVPLFSGMPERRWVRRFFIANACITPVVGLVYFYPVFSVPLLLLALPWAVTAAGSFYCLAMTFRSETSAA